MVVQVLNVAEKPSVAKEIASILSNGSSQRRQGFSQYNPVYEWTYQIKQQPVRMIMTSVTGHLMELDFPSNYRSWYSCDPAELFTAPVQKKTRSDETQQKIEKTLRTEARKSQWLVLWLDCDREGENIAFEVKAVCEQANSRLRVFRARFSALIPRDIIHAVQNLSVPDERLSLACDARSEIDLRIGAAFTRFQTMRIQRRFPTLQKDNKSVISYGPCQFPTLGFVVERFLQIKNFEKEAFYYLSVTHQDIPTAQNEAPPTITFKWKRERLFDRTACLCIYEELLEQPIATIVSVDKRATFKRKPLPLTTVELQKRVSRWLRLSSEQTMKAAESLYNKGLLSYPRTETNKFKEGMNLMALVQLHQTNIQWGSYVTNELLQRNKYEPPRHGGSDDQAHPPIHPTKSVDPASISDPAERKVYEFVTLHFLAGCSRDAVGHQTNVRMQIVHEEFTATGLMISERNYLDIYRYEKWNASAIPVYQQGDRFRPTTLLMLAGETAPPPLLSESDLIAKMDANDIGTDATIAEHIKTILKREYAIKVNNNTQFQPTTLGLALVLSYEQMGFDLAKPALRAAMERDCKAISLGQKDLKRVITTCMEQMKEIFLNVSRRADVLDQTFAEHFDCAPSDAPAPRLPPSMPPPPPPVSSLNSTRPSSAPNRSLPMDADGSNAPVCGDHGLPCIERQVHRDGPNKGRRFYVCSLPQDQQCNHFAWIDDSSATTTTPSHHNRPSISSSPSEAVVCSGHNETCVERTVRKEGVNKGRVFYSCPRPQIENCGFFQWKDDVQTQISPSQPLADATNAPKCRGHQLPCALRTCRKPGDNQNREFYACSHPPASSCGFFLWKDEHTSPKTTTRNHHSSASDGLGKCDCGLEPVRLTCKNGANKGRAFLKCSRNMGEQCQFFSWADGE